MKNSYSTQIFRIDGKNSFVEALNSTFQSPLHKLQLNFVEYDPNNNNKQSKNLPIYMDIISAVALAERILSGSFETMVEKAKAEGKFNGSTINQWTSFFTDMGGLSEEKVAKKFDDYQKQYPFLQPGMAISRQFKIQTGSKYPWVLRAEYGPGQSSETGLIVPKGTPPMVINIPIDADSLYKLAAAIKYHYQAYLASYYVRFGNQLWPGDQVNIYNNQK